MAYNPKTWTEGTVVKPARVVIDGVEHEVLPEERTGATPLTPEDMNNIAKTTYVQNITTAGTNLDDYTENGIYFFQNTNIAPVNIPAGSNGWLVVLNIPNGDYIKQIWYRFGSVSNHYQTFVRTKISEGWTEWQRVVVEDEIYYKDGDTFQYHSEFVLNGFISGGGTSIEVYPIILHKRIDKINSITLNSCSVTLRGANGYIDGISGYRNIFEDEAFTITVNKISNYSCKLTIAKSSAFTNITNNTLVSAKVRLSLTFNE